MLTLASWISAVSLLAASAGCGTDAGPAGPAGGVGADVPPSADAGGAPDGADDGPADAAPPDTAQADTAQLDSADQGIGTPDAVGDAKVDAGQELGDAGEEAGGGPDGTEGPDETEGVDGADDAGTDDTGPEDAGPKDAGTDATAPAPQPEPAQIGPPVAAQIDVLWTLQPSFVAPAQGAVVLAQAGTLTALLDQPGLPPTLLLGDPGPAWSMAVMPGPQYLLATGKGLYGLQGKKWGVSPVQPWIGAKPLWLLVQPAAGSAGPQLWIGQAAGLWRHDGQLLQPVAVPDADLSSALLLPQVWSTGPQVSVAVPGQAAPKWTPALWLYANGALRALTTADKTAQIWHDQDLPAGKQLAGDGTGQLWWLLKDGTVHRRDPEGSWQWLALPEAVTAMAARAEVPYSAVATSQGLWLQQQAVFFPVTGTAGMKLRGMTETGAILAVSKLGLVRVTPGKPTPPPPPSWSKDIQPLHDAKCGTCHGPAAVTVKLHTAALWKQWFTNIQKQLSTDAMPLVGTKLTAAQKALVKAWGAGGFAP